MLRREKGIHPCRDQRPKKREALVEEKDVVIGISTSGNSQNVLEGIKSAQKIGAKTIGLSGKGGGRLSQLVEIPITIPSGDWEHVQKAVITLGHIICQLVEKELFRK